MECYSSKTCFVNHAQRHSNFKILRRERISQQTPFVPHCFTFYCLRYTSATGKGERKWETFSTNNVLFVLQWSNTLQRPPRGLITLQRPPRGLIYYTGHQGGWYTTLATKGVNHTTQASTFPKGNQWFISFPIL